MIQHTDTLVKPTANCPAFCTDHDYEDGSHGDVMMPFNNDVTVEVSQQPGHDALITVDLTPLGGWVRMDKAAALALAAALVDQVNKIDG